MKKKITIAILALVLVFTFTNKADAQTFKDINGHWAKEYIEWAADNGIFTGYKDGYFKPDKKLTRAEFIQIITSIKGTDLIEVPEIDTKDVPTSSWYRKAYEDLIGMRILGGIETFKPEEAITRDEAFGLLAQLFPYKEQQYQLSFADNADIRRYRDIAVLKEMDLISGDTRNRLNPNKGLSRAEFSSILYNIENKSIQLNIEELYKAMADYDFYFDFNENFDLEGYMLRYRPLGKVEYKGDPQLWGLLKAIENQKPTFTYHKKKGDKTDPGEIAAMLTSQTMGKPEALFFNNNTFFYTYTKNTVTLQLNYIMSAAEGQDVKDTINTIKYQTMGMSDYEKVKYIHDWIVNNARYASGNDFMNVEYIMQGGINAYSPISIFRGGEGVCQAYAGAFNILAKACGISTKMVVGEATSNQSIGPHGWNLVNVDGKIYHVDTTWDDPVTHDGTDILRYDYFLVDDDTLAKNHGWQGDMRLRAKYGCLNENINKVEDDYYNYDNN